MHATPHGLSTPLLNACHPSGSMWEPEPSPGLRLTHLGGALPPESIQELRGRIQASFCLSHSLFAPWSFSTRGPQRPYSSSLSPQVLFLPDCPGTIQALPHPLDLVLWVELCPWHSKFLCWSPNLNILVPKTLVPKNVTSLGNRVIADTVKLRGGHSGVE